MDTAVKAAKDELGVTPNLPHTEAEKAAVASFKEFEQSETKHRPIGLAFGRAMITLREEIKAAGKRNFMQRVRELGITHEKARYWMNEVKGKANQRGKVHKERVADWDDAKECLDDLYAGVKRLKQTQPRGFDDLLGPLHSFVDMLGYNLVPKN